ncbi:uncharacterized protein LOC106649294 [Trichogramma pretiosum]|uniref:Uncharacterized protein n=1 Tax=Trichogramma kaykai TaxID=54128 RepID=A0ABD2VV30_9HYME|nr:uncharacterized protein LOC106649294 [Trichogramma pretiosum]
MARASAAALSALAVALLSLSSSVKAGCILERGVTTPNEHDAYTCIRSQDMKADLARLPMDNMKLLNVDFRDSKIQKIGKDDLQKLGTKALGISIVHSGLEDIDEEAFRGLTELKALILRRNRLIDVRKSWFKDLDKLESLDLSGNVIRVFDTAIFDHTPMIQEFEISENQLTHFDIDAMKNKWPKLKKAGLQWNPYEWGQGVKVIDYANANPSIVKNSRASIDGLRDTAKLIKECQATLQKKDDAKELDICMQGKLTKAIEFPKLLEGDKNSSDTKSA